MNQLRLEVTNKKRSPYPQFKTLSLTEDTAMSLTEGMALSLTEDKALSLTQDTALSLTQATAMSLTEDRALSSSTFGGLSTRKFIYNILASTKRFVYTKIWRRRCNSIVALPLMRRCTLKYMLFVLYLKPKASMICVDEINYPEINYCACDKRK